MVAGSDPRSADLGFGNAHLSRGFFIELTVFGGVDNGSTIGREEIFGPVLCVIAANDEQHAIELANDTIYGLNASVFTNAGRPGGRSFGQARSRSSALTSMKPSRLPIGGGGLTIVSKRIQFAHVPIVMLAGGDKSNQARDIKRAQRLLQQLDLQS